MTDQPNKQKSSGHPQSLADALAQMRSARPDRPKASRRLTLNMSGRNRDKSTPNSFDASEVAESVVPLYQRYRKVKCETCGDMGSVTRNVEVGHPDFGKSFPCPDCAGPPQVREKQERVLTKYFDDYWMHDSPKLLQFDLQTFIELDHYFLAGKAEAVNAAQQWAAGEPVSYETIQIAPPTATPFVPSHALLLYGNPGMGKTCLAAAAYRARLGNRTGLAIEYNALMQALLGQVRDDGDVNAALKRVARVPLLFLDDLGNTFIEGMETAGRLRWLFEIINYRYNYRLPTIITTNLDFEQMVTQFDFKLTERLVEWAVQVEVGGRSLRIAYREVD